MGLLVFMTTDKQKNEYIEQVILFILGLICGFLVAEAYLRGLL